MKLDIQNLMIVTQDDIRGVLKKFANSLKSAITDIDFDDCIETYLKSNQWKREWSLETNIKNFCATIVAKNRFELITIDGINFYAE